MAHHFQHLTPRGGDFPYLDRDNVYKYRNDFDYFRWAKASTLELANVPFDSEFTEIVDWQTTANRDAEISSLVFYTSAPLESNFRLDKHGVIKVPLPFDEADTANYLIVRNGQAATVGAVDFEKSGGVRDLFFFILDCEQLAPNTTRLTLKLDVWTTYFDRLQLAAGYVERGHAPMWHAATPTVFLGDPLSHTEHLTAADIEVNSAGEIVTYNRPTLLDTSEHLVCFAWQYDRKTLSEITQAAKVDPVGVTPPAYSGTYSENVTGFNWNFGADTLLDNFGYRTVKDARNRPPQALGRNSLEQPGPFVWGVYSSEAYQFFEDLFSRMPHLAQNIDAVFLVPSHVINRVLEFELLGHLMFMVQPKQVNVNIKLEPSLFDYSPRYAGLTKLYTSPYSKLILGDCFGNETEVNIQDCTSALHVKLAATLLSGCKLRAELAGVGGVDATYRWNVTSIADAQEETVLPARAGAFFMEKQLPVYKLAISAATLHDLSTAKTLEAKRRAAIQSYQNGQRSAGAGYETTLASLRTSQATGKAANATSYNNGIRSANTALTNANASTNNTYANNERSIANGRTNDLASLAASQAQLALDMAAARQNRDIEVDFLDENNLQQREKATFQFNINRQTRAANLAQSVEYQAQSLQNQQAAQASHTAMDSAMGALGSTVSGAVSGGPVGAVGGIISGLFGAMSNYASMKIDQNAASAESTLSIHKETEMAEIETEADRAKINNAAGAHSIGGLATDYSMNTQIVKQRALTVSNMDRKLNLDLSTKQQSFDINYALQDAMSQRNTATARANNTASRDVSLANSGRENATTLQNLAAQRATSDSNIDQQTATGEANARQMLDVGTVNAKASLELAPLSELAAYEAAAMRADSAVTQTSGDGFIYDLRRDGFQVQIRTPNKDQTAQLGDFFLRYGYAANRMYDMTRLSLYSKFTYWQTGEVMFKQVANAHIMNRVKAMFNAGVTVWRKMSDIGTFCIYENERLA